MKRLLAMLALLCAGCAATPLDIATTAANQAHGVAEQASAILEQRCIAKYKRAHADIRALDVWCGPARVELDAYETAWLELSSAVVASKADEPNEGLLVARVANLKTTGHALAVALGASR